MCNLVLTRKNGEIVEKITINKEDFTKENTTPYILNKVGRFVNDHIKAVWGIERAIRDVMIEGDTLKIGNGLTNYNEDYYSQLEETENSFIISIIRNPHVNFEEIPNY